MDENERVPRRSRWPWVAGGAAAGGAAIVIGRRRAGNQPPSGDVSAGPPPHPRDLPILGSLPEFGRDFVQTFLNGWHECGDVTVFRGPRPMCLVAHPDFVRHVLEDPQGIYRRSHIVVNALEHLMGGGVFRAAGADWEWRQRIVFSKLHGEHAAGFGEAITGATTDLLNRWGGRVDPFDIFPEMRRLGLDIIERIVFGPGGSGDGERFRQAVTTATEYVIPNIMALFTPPEPVLPSYYRYRAALRDLDELLYPAIRARRDRPTGDLLSLLLEGRDGQTGASLGERQVRDEAATAIFGAYKSIAQGLGWAWYALSTHPDVRRRLEAELEGELAGRVPAAADLSRLRYTAMVIDEVLRLYPPLWIMSRVPTRDDTIGGYHIPAGIFVLVSLYITHRHPEFWENPEGFDPERFAPGQGADRHPYAYIPFIDGPRRCTGDALGLMALRQVVATIAQHYRVNITPGQPLTFRQEFILRPRDGMLVTLERRQPLARVAVGGRRQAGVVG